MLITLTQKHDAINVSKIGLRSILSYIGKTEHKRSVTNNRKRFKKWINFQLNGKQIQKGNFLKSTHCWQREG